MWLDFDMLHVGAPGRYCLVHPVIRCMHLSGVIFAYCVSLLSLAAQRLFASMKAESLGFQVVTSAIMSYCHWFACLLYVLCVSTLFAHRVSCLLSYFVRIYS